MITNSDTKMFENSWKDCLKFIIRTLNKGKGLSDDYQEHELVFEYVLPSTPFKRPDVLLLTENKVIILEFKEKDKPQNDNQRNDFEQIIGYKHYIENHHEVTNKKKVNVNAYLVCTTDNAVSKEQNEITILTKDNFKDIIKDELNGQEKCGFIDEWLSSRRSERIGVIEAITKMYREKKIPYLSNVNEACKDKVLEYIKKAKENKERYIILIGGIPGSGKTAVGQIVVYEENMNRKNKEEVPAVYVTANQAIISVLKNQLNNLVSSDTDEDIGDAVIRQIKDFQYDLNLKRAINKPIIFYDEAQRCWNAEMLKERFNTKRSQLEQLLNNGNKEDYAVIICSYGYGQSIDKNAETGISLWTEALKNDKGWKLIAPDKICPESEKELTHEYSSLITSLDEERVTTDKDLYLNENCRQHWDFYGCNEWVEKAIVAKEVSLEDAKKELKKTHMNIYLTRDMECVREYKKKMESGKNTSYWKFGIMRSNFVLRACIEDALPGMKEKDTRIINNIDIAKWYEGACNNLESACNIYGIQGLELECPIIIFGGDYNCKRKVKGSDLVWEWKASKKDDDGSVRNNYRILLTRSREEMILLIPEGKGLDNNLKDSLDQTYEYFEKMGMEKLEDKLK